MLGYITTSFYKLFNNLMIQTGKFSLLQFFKCVAVLSTKKINAKYKFACIHFQTVHTNTSQENIPVGAVRRSDDRFGRRASRDTSRDNSVPVAAQTVGGP